MTPEQLIRYVRESWDTPHTVLKDDLSRLMESYEDGLEAKEGVA